MKRLTIITIFLAVIEAKNKLVSNVYGNDVQIGSVSKKSIIYIRH